MLALQEWLRISYKDALYCLYIAELGKLTTNEWMFKAFANLQASTDKALMKAYKSVKYMKRKKDTDQLDDM